MVEINFNKEVKFMGRNGYFKCIGVKIYTVYDVITICPITSKKTVGNCEIQIPKENRDEFIKVLQNV